MTNAPTTPGRRIVRRLAAAGAIGVTVASGLLIGTAPAQAAGRDGSCDSGEFCYYYNSDNAGSVSDFTSSISDLGDAQPSCYDFKSAGSGQGVCVKNNAASVWNRTSGSVTVFYNSGYGGDSQTVAAGAKVNLKAGLKNENASHQFGGGGGTTRVDMSDALYSGGGGRLTCAYDGYVNTPGKHEGIDFAKGSGATVKALVGGKITNVVRGSGLTTIAVYNANLNKTIIYLHTNPYSGLSIGQSVSKGQAIASESDKGSGGAVHTHVEMRIGSKTVAAKSVNDYTLDNPNPNSFWVSQGYNVK